MRAVHVLLSMMAVTLVAATSAFATKATITWYDHNLLYNADAEYGNDGQAGLHWRADSTCASAYSIVSYGSVDGELTMDYAKANGCGDKYFHAALSSASSVVTTTQETGFTVVSDTVDAGVVTYTVRGLFGGTPHCTGQLIVRFFDRAGAQLSSDTSSAIADGDRNGDFRALVSESRDGAVPAHAATAKITMRFFATGAVDAHSAAFADNISFQLHKRH